MLILFFALAGEAEQLPLKRYTTAEGLPGDHINRIVLDSHGFLWICTTEGLSRFDGYAFTNYSTDHGLPHRAVMGILETRSGQYWVATGAGLCRFNPTGLAPQEETANADTTRIFTTYLPKETNRFHVNSLLEDRRGTIWCGTAAGLFRLIDADGKGVSLEFVEFAQPNDKPHSYYVNALLEDSSGNLWIGTEDGVYLRTSDGRLQHFTQKNGLSSNAVKSLALDRKGRLWLGTPSGLCKATTNPGGGRLLVENVYSLGSPLWHNWVTSILPTADGKLWLGTPDGFCEFSDSNQSVRRYTTRHGLSSNEIWAVAEDAHGDLWIGSESGGAMKIARNGFTSYSKTDGLSADRISSIFQNKQGDLIVLSTPAETMFVSKFNGRTFQSSRINLPRSITSFGWGWYQTTFQDREGDWWVATGQGLCRYSKLSSHEQLSTSRPTAVYTTSDGLAGDNIFRLFEDSRGDIWIGSSERPHNLTRWDRRTGAFRIYTDADGVPTWNGPSAFCEDSSGNIWIGLYGGELLRYRKGKLSRFKKSDGLPDGRILGMLIDRSRRLWFATNLSGLCRVDDPAAPHPTFVMYTKKDGLSSNDIRCIVEDQRGTIYVGTSRGVDVLDPGTGRIKHYSRADGLSSNEINVAYCDHEGVLWFGTLQGLSRFVPPSNTPHLPPPVLITSLHVAGQQQHVSAIGEREIRGIELRPEQNNLQIEFVGLAFALGEALRYSYKLEGADDAWSTPTYSRSVNFANLSPGSYRFFVHSITTDDVTSTEPAVVEFAILPPFWRRWWFAGMVVMSVAFMLYGAYRMRVRRLIELERLRLRIASDLHDELAINLSSIATFSDLIQHEERGLQSGGPSRSALLSRINVLSRESVDAIRDIIWALDPKVETVHDIFMRVHDFALPSCRARGIEFEFDVPSVDALPPHDLSPEQRKHLWLIMKEAVHNALKHSECRSLSFKAVLTEGVLEVTVHDDGLGFEPTRSSRGKGLSTMRMRAQRLGGTLEIVAADARGSTIIFRSRIHK